MVGDRYGPDVRSRFDVVALAALVLVLVLAGACTADDRPEADQGGARATDEAAADAAVLEAGDFGPEWEQLAAEPGERPRSRRAVARCLGEDPDVLYPDREPAAESPVFVSPTDQEVSSRVAVAPTERAAMRRFRVLTSADARGCVADELQRYLEDGDPFPQQRVEIGAVRVTPVPVPDLGDDAEGHRISVPLTADGGRVDLHVTHVLVRVGRALVTVQASSLFDPFPPEVLAQLAAEVLGRVDEDAVV